MKYDNAEIMLQTRKNSRQQAHNSLSCNILLIEDCHSDTLIFRKMLKKAPDCEHFTVIDTPRLTNVFTLIEENQFDIIFLDLNLPDIDGSASVAALQAIAPNIPVIVYSSVENLQLREEAMICGAKSFLTKNKQSPYSIKFMIEENRLYSQH